MANSRQGGAFGFLRKSIGSVTYSTIKDGKGKRIQVARSKPVEVANPNTVAQILQRMKVKPAARFFNAFAEILDNAFEGVAYGPASRRHFMGLAMSQTGPYIPKGATRFIPAKYPVSEGSLAAPAVDGIVEVDDLSSMFVNQTGLMAWLSGDDGVPGDNTFGYHARQMWGGDVQVTVMVVTQAADGTFETKYGRFLTSELPDTPSGSGTFIFNFGNGAGVVAVKDELFALGGAGIPVSGEAVNPDANRLRSLFTSVVAGAFIFSKKEGENWVRTNTVFSISPALEVNLYGQEAMAAAIDSYQSAQGVNSLNSAWYLNLANGQPFYGQLSNKPFTLEFEGEEGATIQREIVSPIGSVVNTYGNLQPLIPVDASGNLIVLSNGVYTTMDDPTYGAAEGAKVKAADVYLWMTGSSQTYTWKEAYSIQIQA